MNGFVALFYPHGARLLAIAAIVVLYGFARLPQISSQERDQLAANFAFQAAPLPELPGPTQTVRSVNPALQRIQAWISSVGAAVALNDLDGDGLANDICYVDTRTDQVIVTPAPGTGARYAPFVLNPAPVTYDHATMAPMGCLPGDLNEDGHMDLLVYYWGRTPIAFLHQSAAQGTGALSAGDYTPQDIAPGGERWYTNAATFADLRRRRPRRSDHRQLLCRWRPDFGRARRRWRRNAALYVTRLQWWARPAAALVGQRPQAPILRCVLPMSPVYWMTKSPTAGH